MGAGFVVLCTTACFYYLFSGNSFLLDAGYIGNLLLLQAMAAETGKLQCLLSHLTAYITSVERMMVNAINSFDRQNIIIAAGFSRLLV